MEFKNYIETAERKAGSQIKLAELLGISTGYIRNAKANKSGLPDPLCIKIAEYIEENPLHVIAASGLVTEKDEGRRKILESCFRRVASVTVAALLFTVVSITTPNPANASQQTNSNYENLYYVKWKK